MSDPIFRPREVLCYIETSQQRQQRRQIEQEKRRMLFWCAMLLLLMLAVISQVLAIREREEIRNQSVQVSK